MILPKDGTGPTSAQALDARALPYSVGAQVAGYTLLDVVGLGPRAVVYRAEKQGSVVALKLFGPGIRFDHEVALRFRWMEAAPMDGADGSNGVDDHAPFHHPNLARVFEAGRVDAIEFCARIYCRGDSLAQLINARLDGDGVPHFGPTIRGSLAELLASFADVAEALEGVHQRGIVHGHIHPGNLIFTPSGRLILTDFEGRDADPIELRQRGTALNSGASTGDVDVAADIEALGTAILAWVGGEASAANFDVPAGRGVQGEELPLELDAILSRALSADTDKPYESVAAFAKDIRRLTRLEPTEAARLLTRESNLEIDSAPPRFETADESDEGDYYDDLDDTTEESLLERETLLESTDPPYYPAPRRSLRKFVLAALVLSSLAAAIGILVLYDQTVDLRSRLSESRDQSRVLGDGIKGLEIAMKAMTLDDPGTASNALSTARSLLPPSTRLESVQYTMSTRADDPVIAGLADSRGPVRLAALEHWELERLEGKRSLDDAPELIDLFLDDDPAVRTRAIELATDGEALEALHEVFELDSASSPLLVDGETFLALYRALARAAARGHPPSAEVLSKIGLDDLMTLDGLDTAKPERVSLAPQLLVETDAMSSGYVREWMRFQTRFDGQGFFEEFDRLASEEALLEDLVETLERLDSPRAVKALADLARDSYLRVGIDAVDALRRMGRPDDLLDMLSAPVPIEMKLVILDRTLDLENVDLERVVDIMNVQPEPSIRRAVFKALERRDYFSERPEDLSGPLRDPALELVVLDALALRPVPGALPALLSRLDRVSAGRRVRVVRALGAIGPRLEDDPTGRATLLANLARQLYETDPALRRACLHALLRLGDDRALAPTISILGPRFPGARDFALKLLELPGNARLEEPQLLVLVLKHMAGIEGLFEVRTEFSRIRREVFMEQLRNVLDGD